MDPLNAIIAFFQTGGLFMYPIALVLMVGLVITLERWVFLTAARVTNINASKKILPLLQHRKYEQLEKYSRSSSAPVSKIITAGLSRMFKSESKDDVIYAMQETVMETVPRLEKRIGYLSTLANIATLLGLLGTIIGLIAAFTAVADADPAQKASLLSASISVAMNTTAFGLISAIPLLLFHALLQTKTAQIVDSLDVVCIKFINALSVRKEVSTKARKEDIKAAA